MFEESVINTKFAEILRNYGINCNPQILSPWRKKPDILAFIDGIRVIFEGRTTSNLRKLEEDASKRIIDGLCEVSIALLYDPVLRSSEDIDVLIDNIKKCLFSGSIFYIVNGGIEKQSFSDYTISQIADSLKSVVSLLVNQSTVKEIVQQIEEEFKGLFKLFTTYCLWLNQQQSKALMDRIKLILAIDQDISDDKQKQDLFYITLFILFDALLFHELIADIEPTINKLSQRNSFNQFRSFLIDEWNKILKIDYQPIFSLAYEIVKSFPTIAETDSLLFGLRNLAVKVLSSGVLRSHDIMGRIYHKLLLNTTGKYYATYYTALPSAVLLSNIIFRKIDWNYNDEFVKNFKIIDPACGSGTLLSSSYKVLKDIFSSLLTSDEMKGFYKLMVENSIYGIDVLDYAAHLTLVTLMQHSPKVKIEKSNIYTFPVGEIDKEIEFGSLSYLKSFLPKKRKIEGVVQSKGILQPQQIEIYPKAKSFVKNPDEEQARVIEVEIKPESFDVVIMNPPFSRSAGLVNIKYGYIDESVREKIRKEERKLIEQFGFKGIGHAGLGAPFIILADKLLKKNGIMGVVIPRAILSSVSWGIIRNYLMHHYEIKFIISNHDPGNEFIEGWNWSENTELGEVMIVAQKNNKSINEKETIYINLWNKPQNELQTIDYVFKIEPALLKNYLDDGEYQDIRTDKVVGTYYKVKQSDLSLNWLYPCLFANPQLNELTVKLIRFLKGKPIKDLVEIVIKNGKAIFLAGLDCRTIEELFKNVDYDTSFKGIWGQPVWLSSISPDTLDNLKPKSSYSEYYFNQYSSDLLIAERIWTNNSRVISLLCKNPVIATLFWEIKLKDKWSQYKKIISLWLNSTYGLIQFLSFCINSGWVWFKMKKEILLNLLIPDFIFNQDINEFDIFFDKIKNQKFEPLPEELKLSSEGEGLRYKIDKLFKSKEKSLPEIENYYALLAKEPIFTLKRL